MKKTSNRSLFSLILNSSFFILNFFGAPQATGQQEQLLDQGIKLTAQGQFIEAVAALNRFKQTAPDDSRAYFYSGIALTEAGRLSAAALELSEAVRLSPDRPEYLIFQANVFSRLKQRDHALGSLAIFEKEDRVKQLSTAWLWLLGDIYYRLEKPEDALRILDLLSRQNPEDSKIDLNRGQVYVTKGNFDLALESFKRSIEKSRSNAQAYFELGKILYQRNELADSKKAFAEAVKRNGTDPVYLHKLALVCLARGEVQEAIEYLKRAEPSGSSFPEIYYALATAYQRTRDSVKAGEYQKRFQELNLAQQRREDQNREAVTLIAKGEKQLDRGNKAEAKALFEQVLQVDSNSWDAHGYLAEMLLSSADWQMAYKHLVKMEELDSDSAVGNYLMARYWYQRKEFERAGVYAEKVRFARPAHAELRNLLGNIYLELGRQEQASSEYEAAVRLAPDRADFRENLRRLENRIRQANQKPDR
jgi:Flp pilus assembly protein TadD